MNPVDPTELIGTLQSGSALRGVGASEALRDWFVSGASMERRAVLAVDDATAALERFGELADEFTEWAAGVADVDSLVAVRQVVALVDRLLQRGWGLHYDGWTHLPRVAPHLELHDVPPPTTAAGWIQRNQWLLQEEWGDEWGAWRAMLRLSNDYDEWSRNYLGIDLPVAARVCEKMDRLSTLALGLRYPPHLDMNALPFTRAESVQGVRAPK